MPAPTFRPPAASVSLPLPVPASAPAPVPSDLRAPGTATAPFTSLRLLDRRRATLVAAPEPAVTLPAGPSGAYALSSRVLVVGARDGLWRSTDAGRSWQRTLPLAGELAGYPLGPAGTGVVAATTVFGPGTTTLHVSDDGLHWRNLHPLLVNDEPADLITDSVTLEGTGLHAVGFAYPDVRANPVMGRGLLRTQDGGRHWATVAGADDVTDVALVPGSTTLFAAAASGSASPGCDGHLLRSTDRGLNWTTVASSCTTQNLFSVDFVDSVHGFAAGGSPNHYGGSQLVLATVDGGRTWQQRFSTGVPGGGGDRYPDGFAEVRFSTPTDGLALSGACVGGGDGPCGGQLWRSTDGGRTWHDTGLLGVELTRSGGTAVLTGSPQTQAGLAVSVDGGRTWSRNNAASDVLVEQLSRTTRGLTAVTDTGVDLSTDGGHSWQTLSLPPRRSSGFDIVLDGSHGILTSHQFRLSWQPAPVASSVPVSGLPSDAEVEVGQAALAATDDRQGLAMAGRDLCRTEAFGSADAGRSWSSRGTLGIAVDGPIGYDNHLVAAVGECTPPTQINYAHTIAISPDDGHHWALTTLGPGYDLLAASVAGNSVWVIGADTRGNRVVLVSHDTGTTWTANELVNVTAANDDNGTVVALSADAALLTDGRSTLWRTTDDGATWRQERLILRAQ
ncbi:MAG: hypothetical protein QOJ11_1415 [Frankiales bacterium]|nr:hypothetical protein [Frankiales bacterium]